MPGPIVPVTLEEFETSYRRFHVLHKVVDHWAELKPGDPAVINATRGTVLTWAQLREGSATIAGRLARLGFRRGDFLAASLPLLDQHILLEYACFRLGVIHAPLDLRLPPPEVIRCLNEIRARGYVFPGKIGPFDFGALGEAAHANCPTLEHLVQLVPGESCIGGAMPFAALMDGPAAHVDANAVDPQDGAQVIFTTGSTGSPKPALLSHRGIACQNLCLARAFDFGPAHRVLCNLPASHVGGQAELLMTTFSSGATAVTLENFDAALSLAAIEQHGVTLVGQIPAMFQMEWRNSSYGTRDLSSIQTAVYGGQGVARAFLEQMLRMAPRIATGLGLTETSGFCTYTAVTSDAGEVARGLGCSMPAYQLTVREAMERDGRAGREVSGGTVGNICFRGPQTFLGYVGDEEATARTISRDGWLYTGDLGALTEAGLRFSGREKWVLKPAGYQVFPGDIEEHFNGFDGKFSNVGVVGQPHEIWSEGLIAFVEKNPGVQVTEVELRKHARGLASYMRPLHYVILEPGTIPLNRAAKVDVLKLMDMAQKEVEALRARGRWDKSPEA